MAQHSQRDEAVRELTEATIAVTKEEMVYIYDEVHDILEDSDQLGDLQSFRVGDNNEIFGISLMSAKGTLIELRTELFTPFEYAIHLELADSEDVDHIHISSKDVRRVILIFASIVTAFLCAEREQ